MSPEKSTSSDSAPTSPFLNPNVYPYAEAFAREETPESSASEDATTILRKKSRTFLRPRQKYFSFYASDSSLEFTPSDSAETFAFYPSQRKVEVPLSWFASEKFSDGELEFANYHELSHFIDMRRNPEAFLENFNYLENRAANLAEEYAKTHPDLSLSQLTPFFYQELHTLYNCLDDIYVNNLVFARSPSFSAGGGEHKHVATLYSKNGFKDPDQTSLPLHRQMAYSLLRDEMIGDVYGKSIVSPEVETALSRKRIGKSLRDHVDTDLKPQFRRGEKSILVDPAERYADIRRYFEPTYIELLKKALKDQENSQDHSKNAEGDNNDSSDSNGNNESGSGEKDVSDNSDGKNDNAESSDNNNHSAEEFDPFNDQSSDKPHPDDLLNKGENADETIRDILNAFAEQDKVDRMSPDKRAEYEQKKRQEQFDKEHGISEAERKDAERIQASIKESRAEMRKFWHSLIGESISLQEEIITGQRRGRQNIGTYVRKLPHIVDAERKGTLREIEIYDRKVLNPVLIDQAEDIEVSLLVDCSGSMNEEKINAAKRTAALLMYSLKDFNSELNRTRSKTHSKLRADSQVILFGSDFVETKPFRGKNTSMDDDDAHIIKTISAVNDTYGGTYDTFPLSDAEQGISPKDKKRLKDGKLKKIVFEITDGASSDPNGAALAIQKLAEDGVIVVGFQIGDVNDYEMSTFSEVWQNNQSSPNVHGISIGTDINSLPNRLINTLSNLLQNERIK